MKLEAVLWQFLTLAVAPLLSVSSHMLGSKAPESCSLMSFKVLLSHQSETEGVKQSDRGVRDATKTLRLQAG